MSKVAASSIEFRRGLDGLAALKDAWQNLEQSMPDRPYFANFFWVHSFVAHLAPRPDDVYFCALRRDGRICAIVPLEYARVMRGALRIREWKLLWHPHSTLSGAVFPADESPTALLNALIDALAAFPQLGCDVLMLPSLLQGSRLSEAGAAETHYRALRIADGSSMRFATRSLDDALTNMSGHFRRNLARQRRKLDSMGQVEVKISESPRETRHAFAEFLDVEASGWKGAGGKGSAIKLHDHLRRFYEDLIDAFSADPCVQIVTLYLNGQVVAGKFCIRSGDTLHVLKIGYEETLHEAAPGNYLLYALLQHCAQDPRIGHVSLVTGPEWAQRWAPDSLELTRVLLFPRTLRGSALYWARRAKLAAQRPARTAPDSAEASA